MTVCILARHSTMGYQRAVPSRIMGCNTVSIVYHGTDKTQDETTESSDTGEYSLIIANSKFSIRYNI